MNKKLNIILVLIGGILIILAGLFLLNQAGIFNESTKSGRVIQAKCKEIVTPLLTSKNLQDTIQNCQIKEFEQNGKKASLLHVEYGQPNDCISGCFFSNYCAVYDNNTLLPYSFYSYEDGKNLIDAPVDDWRQADTSIMTGRTHWLETSGVAPKFIRDEMNRNGEFRRCF